MLILTRKIGEAIRIADDVEVVVMGVKGGGVSIGISAPKSVSVHREEIYKRNKSGQRAEEDSTRSQSDNSLCSSPHSYKKI